MKHVTTSELVQDEDYLLIGYMNPSEQLDVAKLKLSTLRNYFVSTDRFNGLNNTLDRLSATVHGWTAWLSSDSGGKKITVPELSAYCSFARFNELVNERSFVDMETFMNALSARFEDKVAIDNATHLSAVGKPLSVATKKIETMFKEAYVLDDKKKG